MPIKGDKQEYQERDRMMLLGMMKLKQYYKHCVEIGKKFKLTNKVFAEVLERSEKWVEKVNQKLKNNYYEESNIKTKSRSGPKRKLTPSQITSLTFGAANKRPINIILSLLHVILTSLF